MKALKALTLAAVGCFVVAGSLSAQTATGKLAWAGLGARSTYSHYANGCVSPFLTGDCTSYWNTYTSPYRAKLWVNDPGSAVVPPSALLPPAGVNSFGPVVDVYCVDFFNYAYTGTSGDNIFYTNLGSNPGDIGITTRSNTSLTQYLEAAYLATQLSVFTDAASQGNINGAIWQIMTGVAPMYRWTGSIWDNSAIDSWMATAAANYGSMNPYDWVVLTDMNAAGYTNARTSSGYQEYLVHATPEPTTMLLFGTGLAVMLLTVGYVKRLTA